jgi:hypothetical protein
MRLHKTHAKEQYETARNLGRNLQYFTTRYKPANGVVYSELFWDIQGKTPWKKVVT